jgi:hypothetical protein
MSIPPDPPVNGKTYDHSTIGPEVGASPSLRGKMTQTFAAPVGSTGAAKESHWLWTSKEHWEKEVATRGMCNAEVSR